MCWAPSVCWGYGMSLKHKAFPPQGLCTCCAWLPGSLVERLPLAGPGSKPSSSVSALSSLLQPQHLSQSVGIFCLPTCLSSHKNSSSIRAGIQYALLTILSQGLAQGFPLAGNQLFIHCLLYARHYEKHL